MTYGLKVWDASGNVTLDTSDRLIHIGGVWTNETSLAAGASRDYNDTSFNADSIPVLVQNRTWSRLTAEASAGKVTVTNNHPTLSYGGWDLYVFGTNMSASTGWGLRVVNENDFLQIDQDYSCYVEVDSGTWNATAYGDYYSGGFGTRRDDAIIMVRPSTWADCEVFWEDGGALYTKCSTPLTWEWKAYEKVSDVGASTDAYGLRVKDASGNITFDSGWNTLKITHVLPAHSPGSSNVFIGTGNPIPWAHIDNLYIHDAWFSPPEEPEVPDEVWFTAAFWTDGGVVGVYPNASIDKHLNADEADLWLGYRWVIIGKTNS